MFRDSTRVLKKKKCIELKSSIIRMIDINFEISEHSLSVILQYKFYD